MDEKQSLAESQSAEVINAAANHAEALEKSRKAQFAESMEAMDRQTEAILTRVLERTVPLMGLEKIREFIDESVKSSIKKEVNGKIDTLQKGLNDHVVVCLPAIESHTKVMKRIEPVLDAFERGQRDMDTAKRGGKGVLWLTGTITAIGGAWLVVRAIFFNH